MKVFAISDLHLSVNNPKPMDIFGPTWDGYLDKIFSEWKEKVSADDLVLLAGDFSWAMKLNEVEADFELMKNLPGKKNHHSRQSRLLVEQHKCSAKNFARKLLCHSK